jgi:ankyrin repeat protein
MYSLESATGVQNEKSLDLQELLQSTWDVLYPGNTYGVFVSVDSVGYDNDTPLHVAARGGNKPAFDALINAGAKSDIVSDFGLTALDEAAESGIERDT